MRYLRAIVATSSTKHASHAGWTRVAAAASRVPSVRSKMNKACLVRLFFSDSSTPVNKRDIDELRAQIALANKRISVLAASCRQKRSIIEELIAASQQRDETVVTLTNSVFRRDKSLAEYLSRIDQLTKTIE